MFGRNTNLKIRTKNGFESFSGIRKIKDRKTFSVFLKSGKHLNCTIDHRLETIYGFRELSKLYEGDVIKTLSGYEQIIKIIPNKKEDVFDIVDAGKDKQYYTNKIVSHNCEFIGSTNTLISPSKLTTLVEKEPIERLDDDKFWAWEKPIPKHTYIISVDVSEGQNLDYSAFSVIDVTTIPYRVVAKYRDNQIAPLLLPTKIVSCAQRYNDAFILVEINGIGLQVADTIHFELAYENLVKIQVKGKQGQQNTPGFSKKIQFGLKQSTQTKKIGCVNLKALIESDKLITNDEHTIFELKTFISHKTSFAAEEGKKDDMVMTLVNFSWLTQQKYFKEQVGNDIRQTLQSEQLKIMDEDLVPFGIIDDGLGGEGEIIDGDLWFSERESKFPFDDLNWRIKNVL